MMLLRIQRVRELRLLQDSTDFESRLADNTVIICTADNGYNVGERGFASKWTYYEQSLRVPLPRLPKAKRGWDALGTGAQERSRFNRASRKKQ